MYHPRLSNAETICISQRYNLWYLRFLVPIVKSTEIIKTLRGNRKYHYDADYDHLTLLICITKQFIGIQRFRLEQRQLTRGNNFESLVHIFFLIGGFNCLSKANWLTVSIFPSENAEEKFGDG